MDRTDRRGERRFVFECKRHERSPTATGARSRRIINGRIIAPFRPGVKPPRSVVLPRVLEYSFNSASGRKFQFPVSVFQVTKQLLELYANLAPSPSSCDLRVASFAT